MGKTIKKNRYGLYDIEGKPRFNKQGKEARPISFKKDWVKSIGKGKESENRQPIDRVPLAPYDTGDFRKEVLDD